MNCADVARRAATAGGEVIARYFEEGVAIRVKSERATYDLVSDADVESEHAVVAAIRQAFPNHEVLGEEQHDANLAAEHLWIVDPLDGTNNFAHRIPHFAVSIAYYYQGQPVCGVIHNPIRDDWFTATRGEGAWHNGRQVHVGPETRLEEVLVGTGFYYDRGAMMEATLKSMQELFRAQVHGMRRFGTASLDLAFVGCGSFGAYFEYELSPWDYAAGRLFVEEAVGRVTTCSGAPLTISKSSVLASNAQVHQAVQDIVRHWRPA